MTLREKVHADMIAAMKAKETVTLAALRYVWSEVKNTEIDAKHELNDEEMATLLRREIKKRTEAIQLMKQGGRDDLAQEDQAQLEVIQAYVPALMDETRVREVILTVMDQGEKDFGGVMKQVMARLKGQADGSMVSRLVREMLN